MKFIDQIIEKRSYLFQIKNELCKSDLPLLFYGIGEAAKVLYPKFDENGIKISHVVINKKYLGENELLFKDFKVEAFEDIIKNHEKVNIFIAINDNELLIEKTLNNDEKINNIYKFDYCVLYNNYDFSYEYINQNMEEFGKLYNDLADDKSKKTLIAYLNQRISGNFKYLFDLKTTPQYFPREVVSLDEHEVFVDCGAYDGDTIKGILNELEVRNMDSSNIKLLAIEPDKVLFEKLENKYSNMSNITCLNIGIWDAKTSLKFSSDNYLTSSITEDGNTTVEVDSIDNILEGDHISFIKMDIEGAELKALMGAEKAIKEHKPKLAVCIYHKKEDLLTIPQYIKSIVPGYKLYLRAHHYDTEEVVLYAKM